MIEVPEDLPDLASAARALDLAKGNGVHDAAALATLARVAGTSRILGRFLAARPDTLAELHRETAALGRARTEAEHVERARADRAAARDLAAAIRIYRHRETARVLLRDLANAPVEEVAAEIADIASACFAIGLDELATDPPLDEDGKPIGFCVLGMGKHGGRELNYSSDTDVVYLYGTDRGAADARETPHEHWTRVASKLTRALSDVTEDGVAFRVDLDLRPEGKRGPMVNSVRSMEVYYESYGQTWERAVWLKARPVAGDLALGNRLLEAMEPFVYRRWLDYATIDAIREMKVKIDRSRDAKTVLGGVKPGFDVKLGAGGIREAEFFAQTLQLTNAGKRPELRARGTVESLKRLSAAGLVAEADATRLADAYRFLRTLEHRLQARELAQTHALPVDPAELSIISASMGLGRDAEVLLARLEGHRRAVVESFDGLFHEKSRRAAAEAGPEIALLSEPDLADDRARALATGVGIFGDVPSTADAFARIRRGPARSPQRERAFRYLARIATPLFEELKVSADPDAAVRNLERFLSKIGGRTTLLALLAEHPPTVKLLVRLFGASDHLAGAFANRPELIDVLLGSSFSELRRRRPALRIDARAQATAVADHEAQLEAIRRFRIAEMLRIGIADLWGGLDLFSVQRQLSDLGDAVVEQCLAAAARLSGSALDGFVVLALGRLGGREMAYGSDVDLVMLYDEETAGPDARERFLKVGQRFLAALSAPTREGIAYRVDTRLRPSGSSGPLVVSLPAFDLYQREQARTWERQALLRARAVAGDRRVWRRARANTVRPILALPVDRATLAAEVFSMREQMEKHVGGSNPSKYNLKTGRGGLVDVEFAAQFVQLAFAGADPASRSGNTLIALRRAAAAGRVSEGDYNAFREGYLFLNHLENRLRIVADLPVDELPADLAAWDSLARRARLERDGETLRARYQRVTADVRAAFLRVVA